ncbi:mitochondrial ribosomal protein subunit-domain-containing protein [Ganoderma leucocontextum]|nr:mitochondrial ribosomal protein subunit-domain-containing protein [Ganoderma leucocontextum]
MATPPPSQFAALLRRSKFASFDPHIGQVYTTFDGHAARGNFGLKRPLALRRRNAFITVRAVDSREQQTVWKSAEPQGRWIRMWDEVGVRPKLERDGVWHEKLGALDAEVHFLTDSEFTRTEEPVPAPKATDKSMELAEEEEGMWQPKRSNAVPNLDAMSETEFERYLVRLRSLRPAFRKFLQGKYKTSHLEAGSLFQRSLRGGDDFREFLESHAYEEYHKPRPRFIEQQPHRYAGLSYTHTPDVQTLNTVKPHIGRILGDPVSDRDKHYVAASAGMTSRLSTGAKGEEIQQVTTIRFTAAGLSAAPEVVGARPDGLEGVHVGTRVRVDSPAVAYKRQDGNPHPPGTREYVGSVETKYVDHVVSMTTPAKPQPRVQFTPSDDQKVTAKNLLSALQSMHPTPPSE